ncbi:PilZ domain-containing protein [Stigmatella sp. ncwal1]|uniref:PilZ domain-containing protein n=1 Tax=Stigmatella ashevillensis TaxID=2995309 RepID=A0ABT5DHU3_9BACT|nr:PilZ domain-containing protein [Stigmatella ashevillena]MDC0711931.1 PilZ domain-containing protein [Stigmatella ashevillena]
MKLFCYNEKVFSIGHGAPMQADNRMSTRESILGYRMGTALSAVASFGDEQGSEGRLVQLSLEHLTLHMASCTSLRPGQAASVVLGLGNRCTPSLQAEVMDVSMGGPEMSPELSLRFVAPPLDTGRQIVSALEMLRENGHLVVPEARPVWKEVITREERILRISEALAARSTRGVARLEDGTRVEVRAALFDKYDGTIGWAAEVPLPARPFTMEAFGYSSVLHFRVDQAREEGGLWVMPLPVELTRFRHRWLRRAPITIDCFLSFNHPLWPQVSVRRSLMDISYEGLSFMTEPGEDLLYPGMRVPVMEVEMPNRAPVKLLAEVRNISTTPKGRRCGMWVCPINEEQGLAWRAMVEEQIHPRTRTSGDWNDAVWDMYEKSGYFRLSGKDPTKFDAFKREFYETQNKLVGRPRLGFRIVKPLDGSKVEASISVAKPYGTSWMTHMVARQHPTGPEGKKASAREALRDIYLRGYEPAQLDPEVKWFFGYFEARVRWSRYAMFDFAQWYEHTGQSAAIDFRLMEGETDRAWEPIPEGVDVGQPTPDELAVFFKHVEQTKPLAFREALDLVPERFDMQATRALWDSAKLSREREVFVARVGGKPVAVGIAETATPGFNLFQILDSVRIIPLIEDTRPEAQQGMFGLLTRAAEWFRERNRRLFIHYVECTNVEYAERAALADLGEGVLWIISAGLLPEFLEHLCEATTPRAE